MKPQYDRIPEELRSLRNWIVWRLEKRATKAGVVQQTKVPYNAISQKHAKSNDPGTWSGFGEATEALKRGYSGLGFCLVPPYIGVDLDGCRQNEKNEPWAAEIMSELDSYSELSPSGQGVHVFVKGTLPDGPRQKNFAGEHHGVGLYDAARGRYLTMTGCAVGSAGTIAERTDELYRIHARLFSAPEKSRRKKENPSGALPDGDLIERARKANDGGKFARLWDGQWKGDYASQSEADLALCTKLAFWTQRDAGRIDALFRRSGLMRDKWERQDYREATIGRGIKQTTETWKPKRPPQPATATINLDHFKPSLELLNSLSLWQGRIVFRSVRRRGQMVIAMTSEGLQIVWPSTAELGSFTKSQAVIADTTNVWIPSPPYGRLRSDWEQAVYLILQVAAQDGIRLEPAAKEEVRDLLQLMWRAANQPVANDSHEFIDHIRLVKRARRSLGGMIPPVVFVAEESVWVHVPALRLWASIPSMTNRVFPLADIRNGLMLLGFVYCENLSRGCAGDAESVCLWRGPLEVLPIGEEP